MADEPKIETPAAAVTPPVAAPATPASPPETAAPAAVAAPETPAPEAKPAETKTAEATPAPELPTSAPTLLEAFDNEQKDKAAAKPAEPAKPEAKPDAKPAEAAKPVEAAKPGDKPAEPAKPAEAPKPVAPEPVEYKYALPETIKIDDATRTTFHKALDDFRANPGEGAQALIDLHNKAMTDYAAHLSAEQHRVFAETRKEWATQWKADEQIGGSGYQTAMGAIARMRDLGASGELPGTPKYEQEMKEFNDFLRITGAGDHPAFGRMMHNFSRYFDEAPLPPPNPKPNPKAMVRPNQRMRDLYDRSNGASR